MRQLLYPQVTAWRLSQHHLSDRADYAQWLDVVSQIGGLPAQMMSAAELALWTRISDATPTMLHKALEQDRLLVRGEFWHGAQYIINRHDYALTTAALSSLRHHDITPDAMQAIDPTTALEEMAWRYLSAYGPATAEDFARWVGLEFDEAETIIERMADRLIEVEVNGNKAWVGDVIASLIDTMRPVRGVRLLPQFDPYLIGLPRVDQARLAPADQAQVYRPQGWISPALLVDGEIAGVWDYAQQGERITVTIEPFASLSDDARAGIDVEARSLGTFLGGQSTVEVK